MSGCLIGIGVGPGDPDLLTIKAINALQSLDVLISPISRKNAPSLALTIVSGYLPKHLEVRERLFPMVSNEDVLKKAWDEVSSEIKELVNEGRRVGFITLGDPMTYSTYSYLLKRLKGHVPISSIPGITSYQSVASRVATPLVEGDSPLVIVPCTLDFDVIVQLIRAHQSLVLMKITSCFERLIVFLIEEGLEEYTHLVSCATQDNERVYERLTDVLNSGTDTTKLSYFSTLVINKGWSKDGD